MRLTTPGVAGGGGGGGGGFGGSIELPGFQQCSS